MWDFATLTKNYFHTVSDKLAKTKKIYAFGNTTIPSTAFAIAVALVVVFDRWTPTASLGADSAAGRLTLQLDAVGH